MEHTTANNPLEKLCFNTDQWATPDLLETISKNPRLVAGLSNPKFKAALEALQANPREAMKRFKDHPEILDYIKEFCGVMGEHFMKLGEVQENTKQQGDFVDNNTRSPKVVEVSSNHTSSNASSYVPLAEKAIRKQQQQQQQQQQQDLSMEERRKVEEILADESLTSCLMDPEMQRVMQECGTIPGRMRMYLQHDVYGPRLRRMIDAGLLQVQ